eukprot:679407-Pleurochrysis_carterae.AAC.1
MIVASGPAIGPPISSVSPTPLPLPTMSTSQARPTSLATTQDHPHCQDHPQYHVPVVPALPASLPTPASPSPCSIRRRGIVAVAQTDFGRLVFHDYSGLDSLLNGVRASRTLRALDLASNNLRDEGARLVADAISDCSLTSLDLSANAISNAGAGALLECLAKLSAATPSGATLQALSLVRNSFDSSTAASLADVAGDSISLCGVLIEQIKLVVKLESADAHFLAKDLKTRALTHVDTRGSRVSHGPDLEKLVEAVLGADNLVEFNAIPVGALRLGQMEALTLSSSDAAIGDAEVGVLAGLIPLNTSLTRIDATRSGLSGKAAERLARAIVESESVVECVPLPLQELK